MKALICITTSNRSLAVKTFAWEYIAFCQHSPDYDCVISLDGCDKATITFCNTYKIPIVYSERQEGVGLSKNRILITFPDYDHYFFIEDDVGLLDASVFDLHIKSAQELNVHHMSLFPLERIGGVTREISLKDGRKVICSMFGGAPFNYFTRRGIETVGGFHTCFAKHRRFGHTEHSYRFVNAGLAEFPFYMLSNGGHRYLRWSEPVSVTKVKVNTINRLFVEEYELIEQRLKYYPITTLCKFTVPSDFDVAKAKRPSNLWIYRVLYEANMAALFCYRTVKNLWRKIHAH